MPYFQREWVIAFFVLLAGFTTLGFLTREEAEVVIDDNREYIGENLSDLVFEPERILTITIGDHYYPVEQFEVFDDPDSGCRWPHYRILPERNHIFGFKDELSQAPSVLTDSGVSGCGFGSFDQFEREFVIMPVEQYKIYLDSVDDSNDGLIE